MDRQDIEPLPELNLRERLSGEILIAQDRNHESLRYLSPREKEYRKGYLQGLSRAMVLIVDMDKEQDR